MLKPTEIWTKLRFDDLRQRNIYEVDFFQYLKDTEKEQFDLVIGNPPFEDKKKDFKKLFSDYGIDKDYHIPRHQIAMLFLQQAMKLLKPSGLLSFVMPSGPLLYNNTIDFRQKFFSTYEVAQIVDLSALSQKSVLFERAVSTAVIFVLNRKPIKDHSILHVTVKRNRSVKERLFFEIDFYDLNNVPLNIAVSDSVIWKANLLGGGQLYYLLKRILTQRKLKDFLLEKKKLSAWFFGEGYNYGNRSKKALHLTDKLMVETSSFTEGGILETTTENEVYFEGTRGDNKLIFCQPHLLIKETPGEKKFAMFYLDVDLIFKHEIIGIHAPKGQEHELKRIENLFQSNYPLMKMLLLSYSGRAGISRSSSTVLMKDILSLPFPENEKDIELSNDEKIVSADVLNYKLEELSKGENAKINTTVTSEKDLGEFGKVFCESLNAIYQQNGKKFNPLKPINTISYTCYPFAYGDANFSPEISARIQEGDLSDLIENEQDSVHYRRVLRLYQKDMVFLIKPNKLRYWLKSIALRDASDVMVDLINSGY